MRVFKRWWSAIETKTIPLNQILGAVDGFLWENGLSYRRLFAPSHPDLSPQEIRLLFQKIPRPCNPGHVEVWFDGIDWFHTPPREACLRRHAVGFSLSDSIRVIRYAGNSFFHIDFFLELTGPEQAEQLRDPAPIVQAIRGRFGKLKEDPLECVFTPQEEADIQAREAGLKQELSALEASLPRFFCPPAEMMAALKRWAAGTAQSTSAKKPIQKYFPKREYRYTYDGSFHLTRRTAHGFLLGVTFDSPPHHLQLSGQIWIRGLQFQYGLARSQICRDTQGSVDRFVAAYRQMADAVEEALDARLYEAFGETPDWYFR